MGNVIDLSDPKGSGQDKRHSKKPRTSERSRTNFSFRLFFIVDAAAFRLIEQLKKELEAPSYGDVVRQAVRAFAIAFVERGDKVWSDCVLDNSPSDHEALKKLNVRIPEETKLRLDFLSNKTGRSMTEIISCGLRIIAIRARKESRLLRKLKNASRVEKKSDQASKSDDVDRRRSGVAIPLAG